MLRSTRKGNSVVDSQAAHPEGSSKGCRSQHEGDGQGSANDLDGAVHHEDGQPDSSPGSRLLCRMGDHLHHCMSHSLSNTTVLPCPDRHAQELHIAQLGVVPLLKMVWSWHAPVRGINHLTSELPW